jgi:hypothetical protein
MSNQTLGQSGQDLQDEKIRKEIEKLKAETEKIVAEKNELANTFWKKINWWGGVTPIILAIATFLFAYFGNFWRVARIYLKQRSKILTMI